MVILEENTLSKERYNANYIVEETPISLLQRIHDFLADLRVTCSSSGPYKPFLHDQVIGGYVLSHLTISFHCNIYKIT
jgi:hypothetical protein